MTQTAIKLPGSRWTFATRRSPLFGLSSTLWGRWLAGPAARARRSADTTRRRAALLVAVLAVLFAQPQGRAQLSQPELSYAGGFLVTGDYAVAGVDVTSASNGFATGDIQMAGIPEHADILAAFLYWETVTAPVGSAAGVQFRGVDIDVDATRQASIVLGGPLTPCYGPTGDGSTMTMFRADVLQLLPVQPATGKRLANGTHRVRLPAAGGGSGRTSESAGASLVVVYRDASQPLRRVVLYDGISVQPEGATFTQRLQGFYQSASTRSAKVTHIVGGGQPNNKEALFFNGRRVARDPFQSAGSSSERGWSTKMIDVSTSMPGTPISEFGETAVTGVSHPTGTDPYECLAWAAVVFSTAVEDVDGDGLPDGIEGTPGTLQDPGGELLPNLNAMGAGPDRKDIFVEVNAMWANDHNHLPSPQVLKMVGDAFKNAPVANPGGVPGIRAHFDVGDLGAYRALGQVEHGDPDWVDDYMSDEADEYLVSTDFARGGEQIGERACVPSSTVECPFPEYAGTVGWRLGFDALKYAPVGASGQELSELDLEDWLGSDVRRKRFDPARHGLFHYVLYAHARGIPKSLLPCLDADGKAAPYSDPDAGTCASGVVNPDIRKPSSASGVGDLPGGNALITLGLWDEKLGRPFIQASTTLHELGHNLDLWHGGWSPTWGTANSPTYFEPNCKPNYVSVMNYLFQARGLVDDDGEVNAGYADEQYPDLDEASLGDGVLGSAPRYRTSWFAPFATGAMGYSRATRYCTGARFPDPVPGVLEPNVARIDAGSAAEPIDWNGNGTADGGAQDVNFDGKEGALRGFDDWSGLRLDQVGSGFNAFGKADGILKYEGGGIFTTADGGILKYEGGGILRLEGGGTTQAFDSGILKLEGGGILTIEDGGILRLEGGGILKYEGGGILKYEGGGILRQEGGGILKLEGGGILRLEGGGTFNVEDGGILKYEGGGILKYEGGGILKYEGGGQELTYDDVKAMGPTPPNALKACVVDGVNCGTETSPLHRTQLQWKSPNVGRVATYTVYRAPGDKFTFDRTKAVPANGTLDGTTFIESDELPNGKPFTYFVTATFDDQVKSGPSNAASIVAINDAPMAVDDSYEVDYGSHVVVPASSVLANDTDADSPPAALRAVLVQQPAKGALTLNGNGSFTYVPTAGSSGQDTFSYLANDGVWSGDASVPMSADSNVATVTLTIVGAPPPPPPTPLVAAADTAGVIMGGSTTVNVLANDSGAGTLSVTGVTQGRFGTVTYTGTNVTYTATSPTVGADSFTYTITDGTGTAAGTVTMAVRYGFLNVLNVPPPAGKTFSRSGTVSMQWKYTNAAGVAVDSSGALPEVLVTALSVKGPLPAGWNGDFTVASPGSNTFMLPTAKNGWTWQFNWKLVYTDPATGRLFELPAGTYLVIIKSNATGQQDPTVNGTVGGVVTVK